MDFSELRHARERLGLSLRDISDRTKIRTSILSSIERNEIDRLPPPIFTRGFVRAYAREVGLDPHGFVELQTTSQPVAAASGDLRAVNAERRPDRYDLSERDSSSLIGTALIVAAAGLLLFLTDPWKASSPVDERGHQYLRTRQRHAEPQWMQRWPRLEPSDRPRCGRRARRTCAWSCGRRDRAGSKPPPTARA